MSAPFCYRRGSVCRRPSVLPLVLFLLGLGSGVTYAAAPTVNGLFYGDGDSLNYPATPYASSTGGSDLFITLQSNTLYVALVVDWFVNDNVFSPKTNTALTASAGWTQHRTLVRAIDSEFAPFTLTLGSGTNEQYWAWQQGTAGLPGGIKAKAIGARIRMSRRRSRTCRPLPMAAPWSA
ncbi:MAG: hypothetical protein HQ523_14890 [Lentisphaerae bacterium]|nr:hypothetical protein [Lentisphaerota bacterium]